MERLQNLRYTISVLTLVFFFIVQTACDIIDPGGGPEGPQNKEFPIIAIGMQNKDAAFEKAMQWGVTHIHKYGMGRSIENDQPIFDRAEQYGLKVMSDLRVGRYWLEKNKDLDLFREYVAHFKEHSALGFWYLVDEPDNKGIKADEMKPFYNIVKEETPDIPVANAHAWTKNWYKYASVQDILMYDYYPVEGEPFPEAGLGAWTSFTEAAFGTGTDDLVIPIIQIFNWKSFASDDQEEYKGYPVEDLRYPNTDELRYMIFYSIGSGAPGIALYSYARSVMVNPKWGDQVLTPVLDETKEFATEVNDLQKNRVYSIVDSEVLLSFWSNNNADFLVFANSTSKERNEISIEVDTEEIDINNLEGYKSWGESRKSVNITFDDNKLTIDKIMPWEIIIVAR